MLASRQAVESQSCTAPKVWPVSCLHGCVSTYRSERMGGGCYAMTCHSCSVRTTTFVPATDSEVPSDEFDCCDPVAQACPSHARPTAEPVGHVLRRVQWENVSVC